MIRHLTTTLALLLFAATLIGQELEPEPQRESLLRAQPRTYTDDAGLLQWQPFESGPCTTCSGMKTVECAFCKDGKGENCPECEGERKSPCRACCGTGETYDLMAWMPCPGCSGASVIACRNCNARGGFPVEGDGDRESECKGCKGARAHKCGVCDGKRIIKTVKPTKPLEVATLAQIESALAAIEEAREGLDSMRPDDQVNKAMKGYDAALKPVKKILPADDMSKTLKEIMKCNDRGGAAYMGHHARQLEEQDEWKRKTVYMIDYSTELLLIALERAKANEEAAAEASSKK